jgi:hypothetical protein
MDTTEPLRDSLIALMEAALEGSSPTQKFRLELTITPILAWQYMPSTTPFYRQGYYTQRELRSTLQSFRASSAPTSSSTPESKG